MTKNLLIITQKVDKDADLLGFFVDWINEFSRYFNKVFVITLEKGNYDLPKNVFIYSLGKEKKSSRFLRFIKFYSFLFKLVPQSNSLFVHMSPIFVIASWPVAFLFGKRIFFWYLHRSLTFRLKMAEKLSHKILTADKDSLNIKSKKIIEFGHGIDAGRFETERLYLSKPDFLKILSVGRISKIKNYETLIKAAKNLKDRGPAFKIKIIGQPVMNGDFEYFEKLKKSVEELDLVDKVKFVGFVPYNRIADYYKESDIFVNLTPKGGIDKVVLEAMAAGCISFVSNEVFEKYFGELSSFLIFKHGDSDDLAEKIMNLLKLSEQKLNNVSSFLKKSVRKNHSVLETVNKISKLLID